VWRCQYYGFALSGETMTRKVREGGEWVSQEFWAWELDRKRLYAQGDTKEEAEAKAERLGKLHLEYEEWCWQCERDGNPPKPGDTFENWLGDKEARENRDKPKATPALANMDAAEDETDHVAPANFTAVAQEFMATKGRFNRTKKFEPLKPSTRRTNNNYVKHAAAISNKPMDKLRLPEIMSWFHGYLSTHAEGTAARYKFWLCEVGRYAVKARYWNVNLFESLPELSIRPNIEIRRTWTLDEIDRMWDAAHSPQQKAIIVLCRLGLRFGEATGLTEADLLDDETIRVQYAQTRVNVGTDDKQKLIPFLGDPKTSASAAKVRVPKAWMKILRESLEKAEPQLIRAYNDDPDQGARLHRFVVPNQLGEIWQESTATYAFERLMSRAGVEFRTEEMGDVKTRETVWHSWRYTYCSELVVLGAGDVELMFCMRHTDANLSKKTYAQARFEDRTKYEPYKAIIKTPYDYNNAICKFDTDRREARAKRSRPRVTETPDERRKAMLEQVAAQL